jgi:cellulose synthase/poly-beta-1,6-N-acetylglucosamine synthase-like glycosyltransferase
MQAPAPFLVHGPLARIYQWPGPLWFHHLGEFPRSLIQLVAWGLAFAWLIRSSDAIRYLPRIPQLNSLDWNISPAGAPTLTIVVPARNEADNIAATLDGLLLADYDALHLLAIDDRSTDATGTIMEAYAARFAKLRPGLLEVLHIDELPDGWLGKTFALSVATERTESTYILYTDADVLFSPSILRRAVACAEATQADHLVVLPTMEARTFREGVLLGFFQIFGLWASRLWKVDDPRATRDLIGVGAFNLVRRSALEELGGWEPQRMAVLEDITLGRRMKSAQMRQRVAFAPGMVLVHWAKGARGIVGVMTKNLFSAFNFQPVLLLAACSWVAALFLLPLAGFFWWSTILPSLLTLVCIGAAYRTMGEISQIDARTAWLFPLGALAFLFAMLRSMLVVLWQRGVVWRGTHYPLRELRQHNSPFVWDRAHRRLQEDQVQARKLVRRAKRKGKLPR